MSYMWVGSATADVGGNFDVTGTASLRGKHVNLNDRCGDASLSSSSDGINWGTSVGTDCELMQHHINSFMPRNV
jgi:hypothetical protein